MKVNYDSIAIATTSFYPNMMARAEAMLEMLRIANNELRHAIVVDGGSCPEFLKRARAIGSWVEILEQEEEGMWPSRWQAMREAAKLGDLIWWTEEKPCLISQLQALGAEMKAEHADLLVPTRKSLESYPEYQRKAEIAGNMAWWGITGHKLDMWSGPRLFTQEMLEYFRKFKGKDWAGIFTTVMRMIADGRKVIGCDVDYVHYAAQTAEEEADPLKNERRRIDQLYNLIPAIAEEARMLGLPKINTR